ncbi:FAD-binding oxidoreductase [soil metagenome]
MAREISRQTFVRGAAGAAALVLSSCRATASPAPPSPAPPSPVSGPPDWASLESSLDGGVILPTSGDFALAKGLFNTRFASSTPAAVVTVRSTSDVQRALTFASSSGLKATCRSGGHSYVGASAADGALVVDLRQMPGDVVFDPATGLVTVSAAANLLAVQTALAAYGRSIPTGSCPSVGVAGLTLGGGLGSEARRHGLTCDALESVSVVLSSGSSVTASADGEADLFWALRGGGANISVATSFTFRTFETGDRDVVTLTFPQAATAQVIFGWHQWLTAAERSVWSMVNVTVGSDWRCSVILATPPGSSLAADLVGAIGVQPLMNSSQTLDHMAFVNYFAGGADAVRPRAFVAGSDIVEEMTLRAAQAIVAAVSAFPQSAGSATAVIESLDGAVQDVAPADSAFPWRRQAACVQWYTEVATADGTAWLADAHAAISANSVGGYVNYPESDMPPDRYFADNLTSLQAISARCDPHVLMVSKLE